MKTRQQQLTAFDVHLACWMLQKVNLISKNIVVWQTNKAHHNEIKQRTMNFGVNADLAQKNEPNNLNSECANILVSSTRTHRHPYNSARSSYAWNTHTHTHMTTTKHFMMLERKKHKVETSSNCRWDNIKWSLLCVNYIESLQWSLVKWLTFLAFLISFWLPVLSVTLLLYRNSFWVKIFWFGQFDYGLWFSHRFSYRASVFCVFVHMYAYL